MHNTDDKAEAFATGQPHPFWASLRAKCPVSAVEDRGAGQRPAFYVAGWNEVSAVLGDLETFSSAIYAETTTQFMGPVLLSQDGERHRSLRLLVSHALRPAQLVKWEQSLIRPVIARLCDEVSGNGRAELVEQVVSRFPVHVICGMCAISADDSPKFLQWAKDIHRGLLDAEVGKAAAEAMRVYLQPLVEERRVRPGDDLISDIVHAEIEGQRLSDEEIYGFLRLLLPAGSESTFRTLSSALLAVLVTPGLMARVNADRSLVRAVVEETLRWDVGNSMVSRVVTRDTELAGCPIPAGAALRVLTSSANRDESRYANADRFDPDRPTKRHMGFGTGPHLCLGQALARLEIRVGLEEILNRLPNLRLDPDYPVPVVQGAAFRSPGALHVLFDAR